MPLLLVNTTTNVLCARQSDPSQVPFSMWHLPLSVSRLPRADFRRAELLWRIWSAAPQRRAVFENRLIISTITRLLFFKSGHEDSNITGTSSSIGSARSGTFAHEKREENQVESPSAVALSPFPPELTCDAVFAPPPPFMECGTSCPRPLIPLMGVLPALWATPLASNESRLGFPVLLICGARGWRGDLLAVHWKATQRASLLGRVRG